MMRMPASVNFCLGHTLTNWYTMDNPVSKIAFVAAGRGHPLPVIMADPKKTRSIFSLSLSPGRQRRIRGGK